MRLSRNLIAAIMVPSVAALAAIVLLAGPGRATPAKEAPWLPEAAAYRLTLFFGNLAPVPWADIDRAWDGAAPRLGLRRRRPRPDRPDSDLTDEALT